MSKVQSVGLVHKDCMSPFFLSRKVGTDYGIGKML